MTCGVGIGGGGEEGEGGGEPPTDHVHHKQVLGAVHEPPRTTAITKTIDLYKTKHSMTQGQHSDKAARKRANQQVVQCQLRMPRDTRRPDLIRFGIHLSQKVRQEASCILAVAITLILIECLAVLTLAMGCSLRPTST